MARPITVTVGPLATASATKVSTAQKSPAGTYIPLNGSGSNFSANSICQAQTPTGAGALTMNGSIVSTSGNPILGIDSGTALANVPANGRVYITAAGNESAKTFTINGYIFSPNFPGPIAVSETLTGPNASTVGSTNTYAIVTSVTVSGATAGAVQVGHFCPLQLDTQRRVILTSAGNDSGITFAITGTDLSGAVVTDVVTGANAGVAQSNMDFYTVTSVKPSGAVASTVSVGTNTVASQWVNLDMYGALAPLAIQATPDSAGANYTIQTTLDDPFVIGAPVQPYNLSWLDCSVAGLVAATTTQQGILNSVPRLARVVLNSGNGSVRATFAQPGAVYR